MSSDPFQVKQTVQTPVGDRVVFALPALRNASVGQVDRLPYSIRILLESCLRTLDGHAVTAAHVRALAEYDARNVGQTEIPFNPARVVLQDFTGVPAVVDLAAMRDALAAMTGDPESAVKVNPRVPCDLVIDHSIQVDAFNSPEAAGINRRKEFERNRERYQFLKWARQAFDQFSVVPPATGIVHQVNLEYLAPVVQDRDGMLFPDTLVGTDSHTTMINGLGVLGWGVGGIEAEAVMLGQPLYMLMPEVVGFRLTGALRDDCTATDVVLTITEILRRHGVVGKFVEFVGPGLADMPLANRATIANMAPEFGATAAFFPVDEQTLRYLALTGRDPKLIETVNLYAHEQMLWRDDEAPILYSEELELDLGTVVPSLAGPKRPQDRISLGDMRHKWRTDLHSTFADAATKMGTAGVPVTLEDGTQFELHNGAVVIAAITSCTNTSNPSVMLAAGMVARRAAALGLQRKPWVKTSLAPGSRVVTDYLDRSGLTADLETLGFHTVGYGCTTCIGNSGPLPRPISDAIREHDVVACGVLSGNRNFEGRINPDVRANYLASPPLVVAYALAGTVDIDFNTTPLGTDRTGAEVYLRDIWPSREEIAGLVHAHVSREQFQAEYAHVMEGADEWRAVSIPSGNRYEWDPESTYVQCPPFFRNLSAAPDPVRPIHGARCLAKLGDSVTTDHISPAGAIEAQTPAGQYLIGRGVPPERFNSFGSRRGNDRVMTLGTFGNKRIRNQLAPGTEGGFTLDFTTGEVRPIFDAAENYQAAGIPLIVLAGADYGMGSSRDWAAKGTYLLGVRAVIAASFERIHRSNLVGMGVLPLCFKEGESAETLGLDGTETFDIELIEPITPRGDVAVNATKPNGSTIPFATTCRIDTPVEVEYYRNGGILHTVLRRLARR